MTHAHYAMSRSRAESAPAAPAFRNRQLAFRDARPERSSRAGGGHAIDDGTRAITTGDINERTRKPIFPPLRKHSTSDHIDTSVFDPDADNDEDDEEQEDDEEDSDEREEATEEQPQGEASSSGESASVRTIVERDEEHHDGDTTAATAAAASEKSALQKEQQKQDADKAEKGQAGLRRRTTKRTGTEGSTQSWKDPETRAWKDNVRHSS